MNIRELLRKFRGKYKGEHARDTRREVVYVAEKCGHLTKREGPIKAYDVTMEMPLNERGTVNYCLECIGKMTIRCAWCGKPIFIGDPVTLFTPVSGYNMPDYAVLQSTAPLRYVGCLRCSPTIACRAGFWLPGDDGKGYVFEVPCPLDVVLNAKEPSSLMVNDVTDINEALHPDLVPLNYPEKKAEQDSV